MEYYEISDAKANSKMQWKRIVSKKVADQNRVSLLEIIKNKYKKLEYEVLSEENCEMKEYFKSLNLPDARLKFALRSKMTKSVQMDFEESQSI